MKETGRTNAGMIQAIIACRAEYWEKIMESEQIVRLKAEAFDRVVALYRELERTSGFASSSWVIFGETLEAESKKIEVAPR